MIFFSFLFSPKLGPRVGGGVKFKLGHTNLIGMSGWRSSQLALGQSTGNDVSGPYKPHNFLLARVVGVPVGRRSCGRLAMK